MRPKRLNLVVPHRYEHTDAVLRILIGLNIIPLIGWRLLPEFMQKHFLCSNSNVRQGRWWTLLLACFSHSDPSHICNNMLALWEVGKSLHPLIGTMPLLGLYGISGIASNWAHLIVSRRTDSDFYNSSCLGASGSISAITSMGAVLRPVDVVTIGEVQVPLVIYAGVFFLWESYNSVKTRARTDDNIAHPVHAAGAAIGLLYGYLWRLRARQSLKAADVLDLFRQYSGAVLDLLVQFRLQ